LDESYVERIMAEIKRLDQLRDTEAAARELLDVERIRRLDQRIDSDQTAVAAALAAAEKAVAAALVAAEKAVDKAEIAQAKVNETQNEFRGTLRDQAALFMPRTETENLIRELRGLIGAQNTELSGLRSRVDVGPPSLATLQQTADFGRGRQAAGIDARSLLFSVIAAMVGIAGVIFALTR
jgi:hypothetical protein